SGVTSAVAQFERWGIRVLRNEAVSVGGIFNLIGLNDLTGSRQFGEHQVPIAELMNKIDPLLPTLLLHHTPWRYQEAQNAGVEVMFSGHTHGGQLWPFGYITQKVYSVKYGLTKMGDLQFILTNGAYTWGPPIRVGAPGEVVVVNMRASSSSTPSGRE
ncbi:MAG: metallophosphoesterase, partial [bacterium]